MGASIVWFRRQLRIEDNPALVAAVRSGTVIPVFIWCPEEEGQFVPGRVSRWWLKQSLTHLDESLQSLGSPLIMRRAKNSLSALLDIVRETGASQVYYNHLYDPVSLVRDHQVKQGLSDAGIVVHTFNSDLLYEPWEISNDEGKPFTTFATFWAKCMSMPIEPEAPLLPPRRLLSFPGNVLSYSVEELELEDESEKGSNALLARAWSPGWSNADMALDAFVNGPLLNYAMNRQKTDSTTTSLLSPHLHYGELSIRKLFHRLRMKQVLWAKEKKPNGMESVNLFLRAIGFREYSRYLCFNFPFTQERALLSNLKFFPWRIDEGYFKAWRQGRTGYPLVDAGMRELWATGWLHNRIRVVVSCFLVKFLQLPWRWGMKYFWDTLLDADLESDILGWQYISGSLPDGHELDRMDNPEIEGYRFDPHGEYVRRWLPELSRLPTNWIHHPWDAPFNVLHAAGIELGCNYPRPIVEMAAARDRLEKAIARMWECEAADKVALANGSHEGLGDTVELRVNNDIVVDNMDVEVACSNGNSQESPPDQIVPSMPRQTEDQGQAHSNSHSANEQARFTHSLSSPRVLPEGTHSHVNEGHGQRRGQQFLSSVSEQRELNDADSTAESCSIRRIRIQRFAEGSFQQSSSSPKFQEEAQVPVVPDIRRGILSRGHLHSLPMMNLEALAASKNNSLSV